MSNDISALMQQIYNYFLDLYHQSSGTTPGSTFLSFEPIATPMPPEAFKLHPSDTGYSQALAVELFSTLVNIIPAVSPDVFQPTGKAVDDFYDVLLRGSQFPPSNGDNTLFDSLKRQALQTFDQTTLGSLQGPFQFHPAYASPREWYDPTVDANWTAYTFSTSKSTGSIPIDLPPIRIDPELHPWVWRVLDDHDRPVIENPDLINRVLIKRPMPRFPELIDPSISAQISTEISPVTRLPASALIGSTAPLTPSADAARFTLDPAMARLALADRVAPISIVADTVSVVRQPLPDTDADKGADSDRSDHLSVQRTLARAAKLSQLVGNAASQPVESNNLTISLKYCLIHINRPWLSEGFLTTPGWYIPGYASGAFSTGTIENNNGVFPTLPVACLAVKDVQITASATDISGPAQQSAAFGPFSLVGRTVDHSTNTLTINGTHILGWFCQLMPTLPPNAPPVA